MKVNELINTGMNSLAVNKIRKFKREGKIEEAKKFLKCIDNKNLRREMKKELFN